MSAAVLAGPDELTIQQLDEAWALPCDVGRQTKDHCPGCGGTHAPCERQAEWVAWAVRCCGRRPSSVLLCGPHRDRLADESTYSVCEHCQSVFAPAIKAFTSVEPLNAG